MTEPSAETSQFRLVTLDVPRLDIIDSATGATRSAGAGKALALVAFLAFVPRRTASRDTLCDLLWGDRTLSQSRPLLRQTLWLIKTQMHDELIQTTPDCVCLSASVSSDVDEFVSAIRRDDLRQALAIYSRDFFSGYGAPGAGRFEEWANSERVRLRGLFIHAAETLARRALNSGQFQEVVSLARRIRSIDPNGQASWRLQLEARIAAGDSINAQADADQLEQWLRTEEWDPEPETLAIIRTARRVSDPNGKGSSSAELVAELIGREREFSAIHQSWLETNTHGARFVHLVGESGVGKTRLARDIASRIRVSRGKVRYIKANFAERSIQFSFCSAIAESLASVQGAGGIAPFAVKTLVSLNPALSSQYSVAGGDSERLEPLRVGLAILDLMSSIADDNPIAIVLDDLHWCDAASREALTVTASRLNEEKVFLLTSSRSQYSGGSIRPDIPLVTLSRLNCEDVTAFLSSLARLPESALSERFPKALLQSTGGVPLRLLEAIRFCVDTGLLVRRREQWSCADIDALVTALGTSATIERRLASLSKAESGLLLLIGAAGMPIPRGFIVEALGVDSDGVKHTVASLELRGLMISEGNLWMLPHDSIAEAIIENADRHALEASHSLLGTALLESPNSTWKRRAIPHLAEARRWKDAATAVKPFLRSTGIRPSETREEIASLLGTPSDAETVSRIVAELPVSIRYRRILRGSLLAAVSVFAAAGTIGIPALRDSPTTNGTVLAVLARTAEGNTDIKEARLDINNWDPAEPIRFESKKRVSGWLGEHMAHVAPRPGTKSWVTYRVYPDSGEGDIELIDVSGKRTRLTRSRHDDRPMSFSPDGKYLLLLTTRWNTNGWSDVGLLDMATGHVRRLSNAGGYDAPSWSPDGTRIAFNGRSGICIADADGSHLACRGVPGWHVAGYLGWLDDHQLLVSGKRESSPALGAIYDLDQRTVTHVEFPLRDKIVFDPTAFWVLTSAIADGRLPKEVFPSGRFDVGRVVHEDSEVPTKVVFMLPTLSSNFLDSVAIASPLQPLAPGVPHRLSALGWTKYREPMNPRVTRWQSLTPEIARIDSLGVLIAEKPGFAVVELSAGGWRKAVDTLEIRRVSGQAVLVENWNAGVNNRWRIFGHPSPTLVRDGANNFFANNGDGTFFSGAYLKELLDAQAGLAMDLTLSTPINRMQWQLLFAGMQPFTNWTRLQAWDHKTGYITRFLEGRPGCWFTYPPREGEGRSVSPSWYESMRLAMRDPTYRIDTGIPYRLRLQVFPDGRCGIAINGKPVVIEPGAGPIKSRVLAVVQGMSVGTTILVGKVTMTTGVPADIDWSGLTYERTSWLSRAPVTSRAH